MRKTKKGIAKKGITKKITAIKGTALLVALAITVFSSLCISEHTKAAGTAADVVNVASGQIGYHEKASNASLDDKAANSGSANYNRYARDIGVTNGQPWCATFVWWCMQTAGVPADKYPRVTYATRDWFRSRGLWHDRGTYTPKPGDYVAFGSAPDHCGIVWTVSGGNFTTIEGNTSDSVASHSYTINSSYVMGFGEIQYSGTYIPPATDASNPGAPYAIPSGNIGSGSSGDGTHWIQTALNNLIGAGLAVDGIFGAGTKNAVVAFQSANGLAADGVVGNDTRNKMIAVWKAKQDTVKPVIKNAKIASYDATCYLVECDVSDNIGVTKVQFPSWTTKNGQDDLKWVDGAVSGGHAQAYINISEHNYESGPYITHIYAWDEAGNSTCVGAGDIILPQISDGTLQNPGDNFVAQITDFGSKALTQSDDKIITANLSRENKSQQWKFTRNNDGTYFISNLGNGKNIDVSGGVDANRSIVQTYTYNGSDAQKWYIYRTKSGKYYFVPKISKYRVIDRASASGQTHLWSFCGDVNAAQLFGLDIITGDTSKPSPAVTPNRQPGDSVIEATEKPVLPEFSESPMKTGEPAFSEQPTETETPEITEHPTETDIPMLPKPTVRPTVTKDPVSSQKPGVASVPKQTEKPGKDVIGDNGYTDQNNTIKQDTIQDHASVKVKRIKISSLKNKKKKKLLLRWKKVSGVSGYQIQYARNKAYTSQCTTKNVGSNKTNFILKGLKKGKKYYVRIRAYRHSAGKRVYGKWSGIKVIRIRK